MNFKIWATVVQVAGSLVNVLDFVIRLIFLVVLVAVVVAYFSHRGPGKKPTDTPVIHGERMK